MVSLQVDPKRAGMPNGALWIGVKTRTGRAPRGGLSHNRGENLVTEWILAFDADCRFCEEVVDRVRVSVDGTLTTAGLTEPRIRDLRVRALGEGAEWAPTLLAVDGDRVRAWTGTALSLRLARLLGPSDSLRVVRALRDLDVLRPPSRRGILKAVPGLALGTFLVTGGLAASPAQAVTRAKGGKASRWVKANLDRLPSGYAEFASYPADYRRAIYGALSASARSDLWVAHFANYRKTHPGLSAEQSAVLDDATRSAPQIIAGRRRGSSRRSAGDGGCGGVRRERGAGDSHDAGPRRHTECGASERSERPGPRLQFPVRGDRKLRHRLLCLTVLLQLDGPRLRSTVAGTVQRVLHLRPPLSGAVHGTYGGTYGDRASDIVVGSAARPRRGPTGCGCGKPRGGTGRRGVRSPYGV